MPNVKKASAAPLKRRAVAKTIAAMHRVRGATAAFTSNAAAKSASTAVSKTTPVVDEDHPIGPVVHAECRVLLCGTFPPVKKSIHFYYPNANNDMWKVLGQVFCDDAYAFYTPAACTSSLPSAPSKPLGSRAATRALDEARILRFADSQAVGFFDVCRRVRRHRGNSADDNIEALERTDVVRDVLSHTPHCTGIIATGTLALKMLLDVLTTHGTFRTSGEEPMEAVLMARQGHRKYKLPPIGGKLKWIPSETCAFRSAVWIHRGPSTSRALPLKLEDKTRHYRRAFAEHLPLPLATAPVPVANA
ncbi:hypothetical protein LSCM4_02691 [Leishmania orientalis]|uniref:Uracil-DNA glycosylase-like domain-containing protein n=1 Tax=Leishmania orientalis TaxID=2249476 RepID=A0A836KLE4_9TRYP|nr:hypothetical protein LSCM4_02691 [Leishmania orientalis]